MKKLCQPVNGICSQCGRPIADRVFRTCGSPIKQPSAPRQGLGDWVEQQLKKIGVTEERWGEAKALIKLDPACNCIKRKEFLNRLSDWWRGESTPPATPETPPQ